MFDWIIRNGDVVDGAGGPRYKADVAIKDGRIAAIGDLSRAEAANVLDATGKVVTPGFIDIHTHYDGQATWDETLDPSFSHGVTTIVMGNCGVGFAPVRKGEENKLIELMEGVEDIPGSALSEGMKWTWESFPDYLEALSKKHWTMDVAAQVPHGPLRAYVMGERGYANEGATPEDIANMAKLTAEAIEAGAVGFSTSRYFRHRALNGDHVPGTYAGAEELFGIGRAMGGTGAVFEVLGGGMAGPEPFSHELDLQTPAGEHPTVEPSVERELTWMAKLSKEADLPIAFLYGPSINVPDKHKLGLGLIERARSEGARMHPAINPRPVGLISSFRMYHVFLRRPSYMAIADLPFEQRVVELQKPEVKARILAEEDIPPEVLNTSNSNYKMLQNALKDTFPMGDPLDFEPTADKSVVERAKARGVSPEEEAYDLMIANNGRGMLFSALNGYSARNLDEIGSLIEFPGAVLAGSDGGAHVRFICDAALPTFALVHWVRDRSRGSRKSLEWMVHKLTGDAAALYGFDDRGLIRPGKRADINVIDFDRLDLEPPFPVFDLPGGSLRLLQKARGYAATFVNGEMTRKDDADTGARPGRLLRGKGGKKAA